MGYAPLPINEEVPGANRNKNIAITLLTCLSSEALRALTCSGLTDDQLNNHTHIITQLSNRCNAGRSCHVWGHLFAANKQAAHQSADDWLCELRDLARKCDC